MNDSTNQIIGETGKNVSSKNKLILIVGVIIAGIAIGIVCYTMSPAQRARHILNVGAKYLNELDYAQAYAQFAKAIEIAPGNEEIVNAVDEYIKNTVTESNTLIAEKNYETVINQMDAVLAHSDAFKVETIEQVQEQRDTAENYQIIDNEITQADASFENAEYEEAEKHYEEAINRGSEDEKVIENHTKSKTYQDLIKMCEAGDWEGVAALMDSAEFDPLAEEIKDTPIYIGKDKSLIIGETDGVYYVMTGELTDSNSEGKATGIFSGANTYSVYEGAWKDRKPNGEGTLSIWNKRDAIEEASVMAGTFDNGMLDGEFTYKGKGFEITAVEVKDGKIYVSGVDKNGRAVVGESDDGLSYVVDGEKIEDDSIIGYLAGVPGFGGSDKNVEVNVLDTEPPVLKCSLSTSIYTEVEYTVKARNQTNDSSNVLETRIGKVYKGKHYFETWAPQKPVPISKVIGYGIKAIDNVDGDLTERIECSYEVSAWVDDMRTLKVIYRVLDSSGNESAMLVNYVNIYYGCDQYDWVVTKISNI